MNPRIAVVPLVGLLLVTGCRSAEEPPVVAEDEDPCGCSAEPPEPEPPEAYGRAAWSERTMRSAARMSRPEVAARRTAPPAESAAAFADEEVEPGFQIFFGNLHSHTGYSDGSATPAEAFPHARSAGLDFLVLSEHNHRSARGVAGHPELYDGPEPESLVQTANALSAAGAFMAMFGQEFSSISSGNHANVINAPRVIDERDVPNGCYRCLIGEWLPANQDPSSPVVLQLNHPWNGSARNDAEYGRDDFDDAPDPFVAWRTALDPHAQLIEIINGPSHQQGTDLPPATISDSEYRRYLNLGFHLAPTANQDNHFESWGSITRARTAVLARELTREALLEGLAARRVYATLDSNLRIFATVAGQPIGSIVTSPPADGEPLAIEIEIQDGDEPEASYFVEVFADTVDGSDTGGRARVVATYGPLETSSDPDEVNLWELVGLDYDSAWDYVYLQVFQATGDGDPEEQAWLAPVWMEPI